MADFDGSNDGSLVDAAESINRKLTGDPAREAVPDDNQSAPTERPRGADGKFVSTKKPDDDAPIPLTPADGSPDPDEPEAEEPPDGEPEEQEEAAEDESPPPSLTAKVKVKVDGIEREVTLDEVIKGFSFNAHNTRKSQELAEERKRFEAEELTPVREERRLYAERLQLLHEALQTLVPEQEPDWNTLRNTLSPEQFQQAFTEYKNTAERVKRINSERARIAEIEAADAERHLARTLAAEHEKLKAAIPDFADEAKGKQLKEDLVAYAKSLSFTDDDLAGVTDHRVLVLLNKARQFDEAQLRKPKVEAKIDRVLESVKPSTNAKPKPKMSEIERAKSQFRKTGRVEDAAALFNLRGIK